MLSSADTQEIRIPARSDASHRLISLVTRRIWLPKFIYFCIPWFYLLAGVGALLASLYISNWYWILPHYVIFSVACLHVGAVIFRRRKVSSESDSSSKDEQSADRSS